MRILKKTNRKENETRALFVSLSLPSQPQAENISLLSLSLNCRTGWLKKHCVRALQVKSSKFCYFTALFLLFLVRPLLPAKWLHFCSLFQLMQKWKWLDMNYFVFQLRLRVIDMVACLLLLWRNDFYVCMSIISLFILSSSVLCRTW